MKAKVKELINDNIKNEVIQEFTYDFLNTNDLWDTYTKPASSSAKYHPRVSRIENEGLYHHTKLALLASNTYYKFYNPQNKVTEIEWDILRSAIILHDSCKYINKKYETTKHTVSEHGYIAYELILKFLHENDQYDSISNDVFRIAKCVRYHMSNWCTVKSNKNTSSDTKYAQNHADLLETMTMICDFISSNMELIDYEVNLDKGE